MVARLKSAWGVMVADVFASRERESECEWDLHVLFWLLGAKGTAFPVVVCQATIWLQEQNLRLPHHFQIRRSLATCREAGCVNTMNQSANLANQPMGSLWNQPPKIDSLRKTFPALPATPRKIVIKIIGQRFCEGMMTQCPFKASTSQTSQPNLYRSWLSSLAVGDAFQHVSSKQNAGLPIRRLQRNPLAIEESLAWQNWQKRIASSSKLRYSRRFSLRSSQTPRRPALHWVSIGGYLR